VYVQLRPSSPIPCEKGDQQKEHRPCKEQNRQSHKIQNLSTALRPTQETKDEQGKCYRGKTRDLHRDFSPQLFGTTRHFSSNRAGGYRIDGKNAEKIANPVDTPQRKVRRIVGDYHRAGALEDEDESG